jgi:hypothetical protein
MGDDNLMMISQGVNFSKLEEHIRSFGLVPKLKVHTNSNNVVFLNMRPYPTSQAGVSKFAPRVGRLLSRLGYAVEAQEDPSAYMNGVAKAFEISCNHVPILKEYIQVILNLTRPSTKQSCQKRVEQYIQRAEKYNTFSTEMATMGLETEQFMFDNYGITPSEIAQAVTTIQSITHLPCLMYNQLISKIVEVDTN